MRRIPELLGILLLAVPAVHATPVRISVELSGPGSQLSGVLKLVPKGESGKEQALEIPVQAPGEQSADLRPDATWEARFEGKGLWGETITLSPQQAGSVRLRVFPTGRIRGTVILPAGEKPLGTVPLSS